MLKESL